MTEREGTLQRLVRLSRQNSVEFVRFIKFCIVGASGAVVHGGILNLLILLFEVEKTYANATGFILAVMNNFLWNKIWVYPESKGQGTKVQLIQFTAVNVVGLAINQGVFITLDRYLFGEIPFGYNLSWAGAVIVVLFWNFGINRLWTFRDA